MMNFIHSRVSTLSLVPGCCGKTNTHRLCACVKSLVLSFLTLSTSWLLVGIYQIGVINSLMVVKLKEPTRFL